MALAVSRFTRFRRSLGPKASATQSSSPVYIYDFVLDSIARDIGMHPPERGGALLGPVGKYCVSQFIFDAEAATSPASFRPSQAIGQRVQAAESASGREFKGLVHSHPGTVDRPSSQDRVSIRNALDLNPHLAVYLAPIVSSEASDVLASHELRLEPGRISFFIAQRSRGGNITLMSHDVYSVPLRRDLTAVAHHYGASQEAECFVSKLGSAEIAAGRVFLPDGTELMVMASELYPGTPPLVLVTAADGSTEQLQVAWRLDAPPEERLLQAISAVIPGGSGVLRRAFGPTRDRPHTSDPNRATVAGWEPRWYREPANARPLVDDIESGLAARYPATDPARLRDSRLLVVGAGSVGSVVVEQFVRAGLRTVVVVDPESVDASNLSRSTYEAQDIGHRKVDALARHVLQINPNVSLRPVAGRVQGLGGRALLELCEEADLIVVATDDPQTQLVVNRFAYWAATPALFIGLFDGAEGGEVIYTVPDDTACYLCAASTRAGVLGGTDASTTDYTTGRLSSVRAVASDVHLVTCAGVKIGQCLLDPSLGGKHFLDGPLRAGQSYVFFALTPGFLFFPEVFRSTPSQHAYQTVWARPLRSADCHVCGPKAGRRSPLADPLESPSAEEIRTVLGDSPCNPNLV